MYIGINGPEDLDMFISVLRQIEHIEEQWETVGGSGPSPGSDLALLNQEFDFATVPLVLSVSQGLSHAVASLSQVKRLVKENLPTSPIVLYSLSRVALLGAGRVVYALGPPDLDDRRTNVRVVLAQETKSYLQLIDRARTFTSLTALAASEKTYVDVSASYDRLRVGQRHRGEAQILRDMAAVIAQQLLDSGEIQHLGDVAGLEEQITWIWNLYSGAAHGYGWPRLAPHFAPPGETALAGHFVADFGLIVAVVGVALTAVARAADSPPR